MGKFEDLTNKKYNKWTVISRDTVSGKRKTRWWCICECGTIRSVRADHLKSGCSQSCGCLVPEIISKHNLKDLTGQKFSRLTVIKRIGTQKNRKPLWLCLCDCGNTCCVTSSDLITGHSRSCGCYQKEVAAKSISKTASKQIGELSPAWRGGISFEPYCQKFNKKKKEEIRDKYDRKCIICGKTEEESGRKLSVHHVDYNKQQGCENHKWVLVPLCIECHTKTNHNRTFWEYNIKWMLAQKAQKKN